MLATITLKLFARHGMHLSNNPMLLLIDNYDSFTYNLRHYFLELGIEVVVYRNDAISIKTIEKLQPQWIVISPGPCTPNEAGISLQVVQHFGPYIPLLGVCLGHQAIAQSFGSQIIHAKHIMHGKTSTIHHHSNHLFANIQQPITAMRYHSLVIDPATLSDQLMVNAWTEDTNGTFDEIMAIQHQTFPIYGVQFHPESILTDAGHHLLANFLGLRYSGTLNTGAA